MLEKIHQLAEQAATNVSRRSFLRRLGRGAMAVAAGLGGLLAFAGNARAARSVNMCADYGMGSACEGVPVGTKCSAGGDPGTCTKYGDPIAPNIYNCYCKAKGKKKE